MQLGEIAKANPAVAIGSSPFFDPQHGPNTNVVLRATRCGQDGATHRAIRWAYREAIRDRDDDQRPEREDQ
jgi:hypothetical protein